MGEDRWVRLRYQIAKRDQTTLRLAKRRVEMLPRRAGVGGELSLGELKIDRRIDELLLCTVAESTGEPLTSLVAAGEKPARGLAVRVLIS